MDQNCSYLYLRKGTYYYSRRVPLDMLDQYTSKRIVLCLRTRSKRVALRGSKQINYGLSANSTFNGLFSLSIKEI